MVDVDASKAVKIEVRPGEMSLHHVRLIHGSPPNPSGDRRIGFAIRYVPTYVRQLEGESTEGDGPIDDTISRSAVCNRLTT